MKTGKHLALFFFIGLFVAWLFFFFSLYLPITELIDTTFPLVIDPLFISLFWTNTVLLVLALLIKGLSCLGLDLKNRK